MEIRNWIWDFPKYEWAFNAPYDRSGDRAGVSSPFGGERLRMRRSGVAPRLLRLGRCANFLTRWSWVERCRPRWWRGWSVRSGLRGQRQQKADRWRGHHALSGTTGSMLWSGGRRSHRWRSGTPSPLVAGIGLAGSTKTHRIVTTGTRVRMGEVGIRVFREIYSRP